MSGSGTKDTVRLLRPLILVAILACVCIVTFLLIYQHWMGSLSEQVEAHHRKNLVQIVTIAHNSVKPIVAKVRSGELTAQQGLRRSRELIRTMAYKDEYGNNYVFMSAYDGTMLVQPYEPDKEMTDQWNLKDDYGVYIIRELVRAARANPSGSFVRYHYHLPGVHSTQEKLAYVVGIPELSCYIGTGMYMQRAVLEQKAILKKVQYGSIGLLLAILIPVSASAVFIVNRNRLLMAQIRMRQNVEGELKRSEERWQFALEGAGDGLWDWNAKTNEVYFSKQWKAMLGFEEGEIGDTLDDWDRLLHPDDKEYVYSEIARHFEGRSPIYSSEHRLRCKDGTYKWILDRGKIMSTTQDGKPLRVIGTHTDISEHKRMEDLLNKEKETLFSILQSSPYGIFLIDADGKILLVNPEAQKITGYTQEEMPTGRILFDKLYPDPEYRRNVVRTWKKDVVSNSLFRTFSIQCKDGASRELEFRTFLLPDGKAVTMFLDISYRKRAEEEKSSLESQLLQAQKMEAVGTLAGGIAHDFNNILTALIGYGNLLQLKMERDDPLRVYVDQILASSEKAANLVQGLLAFSRKQSIELRPQRVDDIVRGMEKLLKRLLTEDIELRISLNARDARIMANVGQMDQVLLNLVTNARDAMPRGGLLTISTSEAETDGEFFTGNQDNVSGRYVLVSVSDSGHGMTEGIHEKIFDPFFTTKEVGKGTGLGLSIVYGIVRQHNGYIEVDSEPGRGTTFRIYLPLVAVAIEEPEPSKLTMQRGTETILIAEDNREVRDLAREILTMSGYSVIEATDGEDALRKFVEHQDSISLVILDVVMPKMNGKEVLEGIRKIRPDVRALFTSGYTGDIILDKGVYDEEVDFLSKPLMPNELLRKLREMLDRQ